MNITIHGTDNTELRRNVAEVFLKDAKTFLYILEHTTIDLRTFLYLLNLSHNDEDILKASRYKINFEFFALQLYVCNRNRQTLEHKDEISTRTDAHSLYQANLIASLSSSSEID